MLYYSDFIKWKQRKNQLFGQLLELTPNPELEGREMGKVVIINYDTIFISQADVYNILRCYIVVDEAYRLKNSNSRLFHCLKQYNSAHKLLLTGTPMQNNRKELWALINFLQPNIFYDFQIFKTGFSAKDLLLNKNETERVMAQEK